MSIETTLYNALSGDAAIIALVSDRIYPQIAPDSAAVPYITYQVIATNAYNVLVGAPGSERKVIQINCVSNTYAQAKSISTAVKTALVDVGYLTGGGDDYFSSTERHRVRLDFALIG